jgi:membrane protease YdiL (CAAX protease family)
MVDVTKSKVSPFLSGMVTFICFVLMGAIPLLPFAFVSFADEERMKKMLLVFSFIAFFIIGIIKGVHTKKYLKSLSEILIIGFVGVYISFIVSKYVKTKMYIH